MAEVTTPVYHEERKDATFKIELPERNSGYLPHQKSPVSPQSNRVSSPGLESMTIVDENSEKPIAVQPEKQICTPDHSAPQLHEESNQKSKNNRRYLSIFVIALVTCIAIALGVGLGVGLTRHKG